MDHRQAWVDLFRKFAHLYDAGVPLAEALELARRESGGPFEVPLGEVVDLLYGGTAFADALEIEAGDLLGPGTIGILRAGESRGELASAARSAADGLEQGVVEAHPTEPVDLDAWLEAVGGARAVHIDPGGKVRLRVGEALEPGPDTPTTPLIAALSTRAGMKSDEGTGAFVWRNRVCRFALLGFASAVLRLSEEPGPEPEEARAWREDGAGLLLIEAGRGADTDAVLRAVLGAFDPARHRLVALDLPAPEATPVRTWSIARAADPDVIAIGRPAAAADVEPIAQAVAQGVRVVVVAATGEPFAALRPRTIRLG